MLCDIDLILQKIHQTKDENTLTTLAKLIKKEIANLVDVKFIWQVQYPKLISNVVMVQLKGVKWWMYIDFTNLDTSCPIDTHSIYMC